MLFRRILLLSVALSLATTPAYSQTWLQRYLQERRAKDEAKKAAAETNKFQDTQDNPGEEIRRAEPVNPVDPTLSTGDTASDGSAIPVRKAEPVNRDTVAPEAAEPVRRAEPVQPAAPAPSLVATPPPSARPSAAR